MTTYTSRLKLALPGVGEYDGAWGDIVNDKITSLIDDAVAGYTQVTIADTDTTLTTADGAPSQSRNMIIDLRGALTAVRNVICPTSSKIYIVKNATTGGFSITFKTSGGTGVSVPAGATMFLMCDGTNVAEAVTNISGLNSGGDALVLQTAVQTVSNKTLTNSAITNSTGSFTSLEFSGNLTNTPQTSIVNIGSGQIYKDSSGNVGIGNVNPTVRLHVYEQYGGNKMTTVAVDNQTNGDSAGARVQFTAYGSTWYMSTFANANPLWAGKFTISSFYGSTVLALDADGTVSIPVGGLSFGGTGKRITGDFSNASPSGRLMFQTSAATQGTTLHAIPNGTIGAASSAASINLEDSTSISTGVGAYFSLDNVQSTEMRLASSIRGAGTYLPMTFYTNGSEQARITPAGYVGIGTTTPTTKLHVVGDVTVSGTVTASSFSGGGISGSTVLPTLTATVAASALTIGLANQSLSFRSSTLSSGVITTVATGALSLTVPSGATLGTSNGLAANIVVLAIYTGTATELAVVNLAGKVNLDESTLISTTALSAAADLSTVIYSTTARTSVPFRVVGYVTLTEATAGTWATAPSKIQAAGGEALTALSGFGVGQRWSSVTRVSGTSYTNTDIRPVYLSYQVATPVASTNYKVTVDGLDVYNVTTGSIVTPSSICAQVVIPPGSSFVINFTPTVAYELS